MDDLRISLSTELQALLDEQIASGGYQSAEDYVGDLIREDARRRASEKLEAMLLDGLQGEATPWTQSDVERLRALANGSR